jgi:hypothetical protein
MSHGAVRLGEVRPVDSSTVLRYAILNHIRRVSETLTPGNQ